MNGSRLNQAFLEPAPSSMFGDSDVSVSRTRDHHLGNKPSTYVMLYVCACVCTESSGADVTGAETLQRYDEPGTPAGI